jgi:ribosomal protein S18 acetylase RimI-like enzyme
LRLVALVHEEVAFTRTAFIIRNAPAAGKGFRPAAAAWKGFSVIHYRTFRNTDPPALVDLWNSCFVERGAAALRGSTLLEYFVFAKPYFDPAGLILACADDDRPVGFGLAGFGSSADGTRLDPSTGVLCLLGVHPSYRRKGIGAELLRQLEAYQRQHGAQQLLAGPLGNVSPFLFGLYGGSQSAGFLDSEPLARKFLERNGYSVHQTSLVYQRTLDKPISVADGRFHAHRNNLEIHAGPYHQAGWWRECVLGPIELHDYRLRDKASQAVLGHATLWEMETFSARWNDHAIGFVDLEILPERRRQGLARFLMAQLLRYLQDQFFSLVELQVKEDNLAGINLLRGLGFELIDSGHSYRKADDRITGSPTPSRTDQSDIQSGL